MHLGFTSNGAAVIGVLLRQMGALHGSVNTFGAHWARMTTSMKIAGAGAVAALAGATALDGMWKIIEAGKELNNELEKTRQLGGDFAATLDSARKTAFQTSFTVPTTSPSENVKVQRELGAQMQNTEAAADILPMAQRTAFVISHFTGEAVGDIVKNLVKTAENRAQVFIQGPDGKEHVDPAKVQAEFDGAMRALLLTGGFLKSSDLVTMGRQSGVPAKAMTREAYYAELAEMAVSQGAARAGTETSALYSQLVGGVMPTRVAEEMQRMGMLHPGDWVPKRGGAIVVTPEATQRLAKEVGPDPIAYITGPLNDLMTRQGMDQAAKLTEVYRLFGRETTRRLVAEALSSGPLFERSRSMFGSIPDVDTQYKELQEKNFKTNVESFQAAWKGFMEEMGDQGVPLAITVLQELTSALHGMTAWAVANPGATHAIETLAAALAGLTALGGSILFFSVVVIGPLGMALRGLVAISGLAAAALRLIAIGSAITSLSSAVAGAALLAARLTLIGSAITGIIGILKLGSDAFTPENNKRIEDLNKLRRAPTPLDRMEPSDGFDAEGRPVARRQSFIAPAKPADQRITVAVDGKVDGATLLRFVSSGIVRGGSGADTGTTGFDPRAGFVGSMQAVA